MTIDKIEHGTVRRTGWVTQARRCPIHGSALELTFDETDRSSWKDKVPFDHDDNRVRWRCDACNGSYTENWFLYRDGLRRGPAPLILNCPVCGGRRVTHECVPGCCEQHSCLDCGTGLEAKVELVKPGSPSTSEQREGATSNLMMSCPAEPKIRSGFARAFRRCASHGTALELAFVESGLLNSDASEDDFLLAWYCGTCGRSWTESCFRVSRRGFIPDAIPGGQCPQCSSIDLVTAGDEGSWARCVSCGATLQFILSISK